mgnify:CR=1 FL=1
MLQLPGWDPTDDERMDAALSGFNLGTVLLFGCGFFVLATLYFGTKGGYYNTDKYDGNGSAH